MWLYNNAHKRIEFLPFYKDRNIESVLSTGDKTLNFSYPIDKAMNIVEENYIRTKTDEYVIKQTKVNDNYIEVIAKLNVEELEGKVIDNFKVTYTPINEALTLMLEGTGWKVGTCNVTKKRTVNGQLKNVWELSQSCIDAYLCELEYDTIKKEINVYEKRGSDKGVFAIDDVNMRDLEIQSNSHNFYTRLIPIGKDGLSIASVNNGKNYIENYQFSNKVKTTYWKDERYTIAENLLEDALIKLDEISQPVKSYSMTLQDLAKINSKYKAYEFNLGDIILLVSKKKNVRLKQRIVKYIEYPENPQNNKVELSTTKITLTDIQKKFNDTTNTVDNVVSTEGTISSSAIGDVDGSGIVDGSISETKLNDRLREKIDSIGDKVNGTNIVDGTIDYSKLNEKLQEKIDTPITSVDGSIIVDKTIDYDKLNDDLKEKIDKVDGSRINDSSVSESKLDEDLKSKINNVDGSKVIDSTISYSKLDEDLQAIIDAVVSLLNNS